MMDSALRFSVSGTVMIAVLVGLVAVGAVRSYFRVRRPGPVRPVIRVYLISMANAWMIAALAGGAVLLSPDISWEDVGVRPPTGDGAPIAGALVAALTVALVRGRLRLARRLLLGEAVLIPPALAPLLPRTIGQRVLSIPVAVSAGLTEEFVFRGVLITAGCVILGLPVVTAALLTIVLFAWGHLYQGWAGIVPALFGAVLTGVYLLSGQSLWPPIALHILADLIGLTFAPRLVWVPDPAAEPLGGGDDDLGHAVAEQGRDQ